MLRIVVTLVVLTAAATSVLMAADVATSPKEVGACCYLCTDECTMVPEEDCQGIDYIWFGPDEPCDPNPCPLGMGACCDPATGECTLVLCSAFCEGIYQGYATECEPNPCEPPTPAEETSWGRIKALYR